MTENTRQATPERRRPLTADEKAHREHLKKINQYKKRRRKLIGLLGFEALCVVILVVAYGAMGYMKDLSDNVGRGAKVTLEADTEDTGAHLPGMDLTLEAIEGETIVYEENGSTEIINIEATDYTNPIDGKPHDAMSGYTTFAVFGVDSRDLSKMTQGTQGDVVILVSINNSTKDVKLCSVYRDFYFEGATDKMGKITDAYNRYGCVSTVAAINRNFDLEIENYVVVNWQIVADLVDMMGGIDVDMTTREISALRDYIYETMVVTGRDTVGDLSLVDGVQHLDGVLTVCYARIRKGVGDDYARTDRQRKIIGVMLDKLKTMSLSTISKMIDVASKQVVMSFNNVEVLALASDYRSYTIKGTSGFPFNYRTVNMIYADTLVTNVAKLHKFLYDDNNYSPSANVRRINEYHLRAME